MPVETQPTIEVQIVELERAGWKRWHGRPDMWQAPNGAIFLGPHGAWRAMKEHLDLREWDGEE